MSEKFGQSRPNEIPNTNYEHVQKAESEIEALNAFDDDEWLDLVHRNTLYGEPPILTPKEFVHTLKHLGFKSFEDFYALDLNSKYEVLRDLGIADFNKPNFFVNSVLGFLNKNGGFERSNKANFEKSLDEYYSTFISFYNKSKEEINEEKAHEEFLKQYRKFVENVKDQEKEIVMEEFMNKIPDIEAMDADQKIELFESLQDQFHDAETSANTFLHANDDIQVLKDEIKESLLKWDRGEFKEGSKKFDSDFQSLRLGTEGHALSALGKDLIESYGSYVINELKSSVEIGELMKSLSKKNADMPSGLELNIMECPQEVQKKFFEISSAFFEFIETISKKNEGGLPQWYVKRLERSYWHRFVDDLCVDVRKFIEKNL